MLLIPKDFFHQLLHKKSQLNFDVLIPFHGYVNELENELVFFSRKIFYKNERLIVCEALPSKPWFAQDWWQNAKTLSIDESAKLKELPNWGSFYFSEDSKAEKQIRRNLKNLDLKRIQWKIPNSFQFQFYAWTIVANTIVYSIQPHHRFPFGWHEFEEDKENPPNRAYLKLWEIMLVYFHLFDLKYEELTKMNCLEVGASPGGWTWILSQMFEKVYAIDRTELSPKIAKKRNIQFSSGDAFGLNPMDYLDVKWFFSDLICTPEKLEEYIEKWIDQSRVEYFVCTLKFKGEIRFDFLDRFQKKMSVFGNSNLQHLYHNKNEVTWLFKRSLAK